MTVFGKKGIYPCSLATGIVYFSRHARFTRESGLRLKTGGFQRASLPPKAGVTTEKTSLKTTTELMDYEHHRQTCKKPFQTGKRTDGAARNSLWTQWRKYLTVPVIWLRKGLA